MGKFKYDIVTLIKLVEERPCLWNKFLSDFKDKAIRKNAWKEIYMRLERDFEKMGEAAQEKIGDTITVKWQNIRDAFVRSLKRRKNGTSLRRNYIYADHLQFLLEVQKDTLSSISDSEVIKDETDDDLIIDDSFSLQSAPSSTEDSPCISNVSKKYTTYSKRDLHCIEENILKKLRRRSPSPDADKAFFYSLLPSVRDMPEDEKTELRIGILQLIQKIKQNRH